jgi:hypothetical protein
MTPRLLATVAAVAAAAGLATAAVPAGAAPRTVKKSYPVTEPVPFPMTQDVPGYNGCWNGQEGVSKNTTAVTLPARGALKVQLDYSGDWDLYLFDTKGTMLAASENDDSGSVNPGVEKLTYKKATKGMKVNVVACNWAGTKDATVSYVFTYA